ncbi:hypothetical protein DTO166G4_3083 [Paecilomyces variotii]|nr:hypothetical protein DTO166G4_3083 [Paecilomyces variotii]KAJ9233410.1 hypothetical protein DTO166G5_5768 [Paecilomyces variotii]
MVLSMLVALTTAPALLGTAEAIRQGQSKDRREEHRARRCNLIVTCVKSCIRSREIDSRRVVLKDNKLYIDVGTITEPEQETSQPQETQFGHPFAGYYLPYPDEKYEGLVSTIVDEPPVLNWIYVDKDTYEVKYGIRAQAQPNIHGPFDCTRQDRRVTLEGWEGFVAVEEEEGLWALYFDRDDNGLKGKVKPGTRVLEIELTRKEKRISKQMKTSTVQIEKTATSSIKNGGSTTVQKNPDVRTERAPSPLKSSAPSIQEERDHPPYLDRSQEGKDREKNGMDQNSHVHRHNEESVHIRSPTSDSDDKKPIVSVPSRSSPATAADAHEITQSKIETLPIRTTRSSRPDGFNRATPLLSVSHSPPSDDYYRGTMSDTPISPGEKSGRDNRLSWAGPKAKTSTSTNAELSVPNGIPGTRKRRWPNI